jgi:hypothetical protein
VQLDLTGVVEKRAVGLQLNALVVLQQGLVHQPVVPEAVHQSDLLDLVELAPLGKRCFLEAGYELLVAHALPALQLRQVHSCVEERALVGSEGIEMLLDVIEEGEGDELGVFESELGEREDEFGNPQVVQLQLPEVEPEEHLAR